MRKNVWFRSWGWIYRPVSWPGWIAVAAVAFFCGQVAMAIDRRSHSASDTLYGVFPYAVSALAILFWIASNTSPTRSRGQDDATDRGD